MIGRLCASAAVALALAGAAWGQEAGSFQFPVPPSQVTVLESAGFAMQSALTAAQARRLARGEKRRQLVMAHSRDEEISRYVVRIFSGRLPHGQAEKFPRLTALGRNSRYVS
jgi:hypothetical protein